jgi:hypothetical protein
MDRDTIAAGTPLANELSVHPHIQCWHEDCQMASLLGSSCVASPFLPETRMLRARIQDGEDAHYLTNAYCIGFEFDGGNSPLAEAQL